MNLNLPTYDPQIKKSDKGLLIRDLVRQKYLVLTPEEWVRQHYLNYLIHHLGYSKRLIRAEIGLKYNQMLKRADIVVFDRDGNPYIAVECKSSEIALSQDTVQQISTYFSVLKTTFFVITNGIKSHIYRLEHNNVVEIPELPLCSYS